MGNTRNNIAMVIGGVLTLVFGILLADVVIDTTTTALTNASIGSFAGASAIGGLIPFIYFTVVILLAVGMMGIGARGMAGMNVLTLPLLAGIATPLPVQMALIALLGISAVYSWRRYRTFRRSHQLR